MTSMLKRPLKTNRCTSACFAEIEERIYIPPLDGTECLLSPSNEIMVINKNAQNRICSSQSLKVNGLLHYVYIILYYKVVNIALSVYKTVSFCIYAHECMLFCEAEGFALKHHCCIQIWPKIVVPLTSPLLAI